jgi:hypothetical protein
MHRLSGLLGESSLPCSYGPPGPRWSPARYLSRPPLLVDRSGVSFQESLLLVLVGRASPASSDWPLFPLFGIQLRRTLSACHRHFLHFEIRISHTRFAVGQWQVEQLRIRFTSLISDGHETRRPGTNEIFVSRDEIGIPGRDVKFHETSP